jgi:hypothetical protein
VLLEEGRYRRVAERLRDVYDLFYVIRNYGAGVGDVAAKLRLLCDDDEANKALEILRRDFTDAEGVGAMRVAEFIVGGPDDAIQADVVGFIGDLLRSI